MYKLIVLYRFYYFIIVYIINTMYRVNNVRASTIAKTSHLSTSKNSNIINTPFNNSNIHPKIDKTAQSSKPIASIIPSNISNKIKPIDKSNTKTQVVNVRNINNFNANINYKNQSNNQRINQR